MTINMVKLTLDPSVQLPTFYSVNMKRILPVGIEHVDVSALLQEVSALRPEERSFTNIKKVVQDMRYCRSYAGCCCQLRVLSTPVECFAG